VGWDTLRDNPARWLGRATPELLLALATAGSASATARVGAAGRLRTLADDVDAAKRNGGVYQGTSEARIAARLGPLGHPPGSPAARGAAGQLRPPYGTPDHWVAITLRPGQRIAVYRGMAFPVDGALTRSARDLFAEHQQFAVRRRGPDGEVAQPLFPEEIEIFKVNGEIEAAAARASANPQFGPGGGTNLALDLDSPQLERVETHRFDRGTLESRIEDPEYKAIDETLPDRALDPDREGRWAAAHAGAEEAGESTAGAVATAAVASMDQPEQPAPAGQRDQQGVR
ncbi:MAG: hypothetical protein ACT4QG_12965, partial [Sporichthyaceae bacterium]